MKSYLVIGYFAIALVTSLFFSACSNTSHKSYAFNLGKALVWPISIFN